MGETEVYRSRFQSVTGVNRVPKELKGRECRFTLVLLYSFNIPPLKLPPLPYIYTTSNFSQTTFFLLSTIRFNILSCKKSTVAENNSLPQPSYFTSCSPLLHVLALTHLHSFHPFLPLSPIHSSIPLSHFLQHCPTVSPHSHITSPCL